MTPAAIQTGAPSVTIARLLGSRPTGTSFSAYPWREAVEGTRQHWAETGRQPLDAARGIKDFPGSHPTDWPARHRYELIEQTHEADHELD